MKEKSNQGFYVYALQDNQGRAFYIGKGSNGRIDEHFQESRADRNPHKWNKIQKLLRNGTTRDEMKRKIFEGLAEDKALDLERRIIQEVGLENLTNLVEGGSQPPRNSKITSQEAAWIKYLSLNSNFGHAALCDKYGDAFSSTIKQHMFYNIGSDTVWSHVDPEKPPFWDQSAEIQFESDMNARFEALVQWKLTDKSAREAADEFDLNAHQVHHAWYNNNYNLRTRFEREFPNHEAEEREKQRLDQQMRFEAIKRWRLGDQTAEEVAQDFDFTGTQMFCMWVDDSFGIKSLFHERFPDYKDRNKRELEQKIEKRYQAMCEWRLTDSTAEEAAAAIGLDRRKVSAVWHNDSWGLKTRFEEEFPNHGAA